jgi:hypothetical protein
MKAQWPSGRLMKCPMENGTKDLAWHFIATFVDHAA